MCFVIFCGDKEIVVFCCWERDFIIIGVLCICCILLDVRVVLVKVCWCVVLFLRDICVFFVELWFLIYVMFIE